MQIENIKTEAVIDENVMRVRLLILKRIEHGDWKGARRYSCQLWQLGQRRVAIQRKHVKALPIFSGKVEGKP